MSDDEPTKFQKAKNRLLNNGLVVAVLLLALVVGGLATLTTSLRTLWDALPWQALSPKSTAPSEGTPDDPKACRFVILEPADAIFGCNRTLDVTIDKFDFRVPTCIRSSAMFVMKAYEPGDYALRLDSSWPLATPSPWAQIGLHTHKGRIRLDDNLYYLLTPEARPERNSFGTESTYDIPVVSKSLSRNEFERTVALYKLTEPDCASYESGVWLVDVGNGVVTWQPVLFLATTVMLLIASGFAVRRYRKTRAPSSGPRAT